MRVCVYLCVCVSACIYVCDGVHVHACVCVHVCVCACICKTRAFSCCWGDNAHLACYPRYLEGENKVLMVKHIQCGRNSQSITGSTYSVAETAN